MYVILTSKPGIYTSSLGASAQIVEAYQYLFYGRCRAVFQIVRLEADTSVTITEDEPPHVVNHVSTKFLDHFDSRDRAYEEIQHLTRFGGLDAKLQPCDAAGAAA